MISIHGKMMGLAMVLALGAGCAVGSDEELDLEEGVDSTTEALEEAERGGYAAQSQAQVGQMGPSKLGLPPSKGLPSKGVPMLPGKSPLPGKGELLPSKGDFPTKGGLPPTKGLPTKGGYAQQGPAQIGPGAVGQAQDLSQAQIGQLGPGAPAQIGQAGVGQTGAVVGQDASQRDGARMCGGFGSGFGFPFFGGGLGCGFGGGALVSSFTSCTTAIIPTFGGFGGGCFSPFGWGI